MCNEALNLSILAEILCALRHHSQANQKKVQAS